MPRYRRETTRIARATRSALLARFRGLPATKNEYAIASNVAANAATGLEGRDPPYHSPRIDTPKGRARTASAYTEVVTNPTAKAEPKKTNRCLKRLRAIRPITAPHLRTATSHAEESTPSIACITVVRAGVRNPAKN